MFTQGEFASRRHKEMFTQGKVHPYSHLTAAGRGNSGIILQSLSFLHVRFIFETIKVERLD